MNKKCTIGKACGSTCIAKGRQCKSQAKPEMRLDLTNFAVSNWWDKSDSAMLVTAGGPGSGKSFALEQIGIDLDLVINPDKDVEAGMSLAAATAKSNKQLSSWLEAGEGKRVWDTTAANVEATLSRMEDHANSKMLFVDKHPASALLNNAGRDRTLPVSILLATHNATQTALDTYKKELGNGRLFVIDSPQKEHDNDVAEFNKAASLGGPALREHVKNNFPDNNSFSKPFSFESSSNESDFNKLAKEAGIYDQLDEQSTKALGKDFLKMRHLASPERLQKKLANHLETAAKNEEKKQAMYEQLAKQYGS